MKAFFAKACILFKLPTRQNLSTTFLDQEFKDIRTVTNHLLNEIQYFCLTTDGWSNINKDPIINYMITTPKPIFYKSIPTKEERHSAENIAQGIKLTMEQAGIDKFAAVIIDNALNMKAAWRILKTEYPNKVFLGCWAHGINLWIKDILKIDWAKSILEKGKEVVHYFRNHQIPLATLHWFQLEKYRHTIALVLTIDTR